jgi:carbon-monoxide dehydrogenase catalytic subunit
MNAFQEKETKSAAINLETFYRVFRDISTLVHSNTSLKEVLDLVAKFPEFEVIPVQKSRKLQEDIMAEEKVIKETKTKKLADPLAVTIDPASRQMIARAHELGVETAFDRAVTLKPCNIGTQGICCKNCGMGPCRLPLPKGGIEGEDTRKGICGATPNTIAARNFIRMIAGGAAAHSDHGRSVAEVFMSAARKETDAYKIKDTRKLLEVAQWLGVDTTVEVDGEQLDRDTD